MVDEAAREAAIDARLLSGTRKRMAQYFVRRNLGGNRISYLVGTGCANESRTGRSVCDCHVCGWLLCMACRSLALRKKIGNSPLTHKSLGGCSGNTKCWPSCQNLLLRSR